MRVTLRQLEVFDAVATLGSVTTAADRLNMSQSAASSALADLQALLRRSLFVHAKGRPLRITDEGRRLHPIVRSLLSEVQEIESNAAAPLEGRLIVGATATIAETVLPQLCIAFMKQHPGVRIDLDAATSAELCERLARFELETALIEVFPETPELELTRWRTDDLCLVVAADHPLARHTGLMVADLADEPWCLRGPNSAVTGRLRYDLHERLGQVPIAFESTSHWAVRLAVMSGGGIGCLSRSMIQFDVEAGRLVQLDVADFTMTRQLSLARPRGIWRSRLTQAFDAFLLEHGEAARAPAEIAAEKARKARGLRDVSAA